MPRHESVFPEEVITGLALKAGAHIIDGTLGDGGHSERVLKKIGIKGRLLGIDADPESLLRAKQYLYPWAEQTTFVRDNFVNLSEIVRAHNFTPVNGIVLDLGWSSPQFAERGRGFSFDPAMGQDEPLDMRYDPNATTGTAAELLNTLSADELTSIFHRYGEEKFDRAIAESIVEARKHKQFERTSELVNVVLDVYRTKLHSTKEVPWVGGIHPATKVFQALRIAVNQELSVLEQVLPQAVDILAPGGRLAIITFHSLEDRIVKHFFQQGSVADRITVITKKPLIPSEAELAANPRARSAKLRIVAKK